MPEELRRRLERQRVKMRGEDGFYRFQVRERRKEGVREMQRRFEEDRRRVLGMRERRGRGRLDG